MDSDPNAHDKSQDEQHPREAVALNYIDKVHASATKQWDAMSRAFTLQTIISLITVAVCIGAVTPREEFSLLGLGLSASINTVLIGSAFLIATFHVMTLAAFIRGARTAMALLRLYQDLGYEDATMFGAGTEEDPLGPTAPLYTLVNYWIVEKEHQGLLASIYVNVIGFVISAGLLVVLPVAAELAALLKTASLMGWGTNQLWIVLIWIVLVIPVAVSVAAIAWAIQSTLSRW
jgi:hypothetical protein